MQHTELSREALAVLELVPAWRRRAAYAPQQDSGFKTPCLILAIGGDDRAKRLWNRIAEAMARLGFHADWITQAVLLPSVQAERLLAAIAEHRPRVVLVFGKTMADMLMGQDSNLNSGIEWVIAPALTEMLASGSDKSRLWPLLCTTRTKLGSIS